MNFMHALATLSGTIIGVGILGLPYVASKAGFLILLIHFVIIACIAIAIHFIYGEVALSTPGKHRIPGLVGYHLGERAKKMTLVVSTLALTGALLAYLIVGGQFAHLLFAPVFGGPEWLYGVFYFCIGAYFMYIGIKGISAFELTMFFFFFIILAYFFVIGAPAIDMRNYITIDIRQLGLPYGVVLFSLWGASLIPEVKEMVKGSRQQLRKLIVFSILIASACYLVFIITVLGVTGADTTENAMVGFSRAIPGKVLIVGYLFGLITTFTSFISLGLTLRQVFEFDFKMLPFRAWALASFLPFAVYIVGVADFIGIIGITGAILLGCEALFVIAAYRAIRIKEKKSIPLWIVSLALLLILGVGIELYYFVT